MRKIFFTDLDGTLLDNDTYSYDKASKALAQLQKHHYPLIICTSKTRAEIETVRAELRNVHPFICENGGAIFIPKNYFSIRYNYDAIIDDYHVIVLGTPYIHLVNALKLINADYPITCFHDMSAQELSNDTSLSIMQSIQAKKREYDEAFTITNPEDEKKVLAKIKKYGFTHTKGGRYYHIMGKGTDKGKAVQILINIYKKEYGKKTCSVGIGDSKNDFSMLDNVDIGYLVMKKNKKYESNNYHKAGAIGPAGFNKTVLKEVKSPCLTKKRQKKFIKKALKS
ncbi:HAD-IIB family hydrolase [Candidatus Woesearchaeota archaeon]|nr:HAD-IIB family hydrolase [Candidatus Woesearchaeota archaeon]